MEVSDSSFHGQKGLISFRVRNTTSDENNGYLDHVIGQRLTQVMYAFIGYLSLKSDKVRYDFDGWPSP